MKKAMTDKRASEDDGKGSFSSRKTAREKMEQKMMEFIASKKLFLDKKLFELIKQSDNPAKFSGNIVKFSVVSHVFTNVKKMLEKTADAEDALIFMDTLDGFMSEEQLAKPSAEFFEDFKGLKQHLVIYSTVVGASYTDITDMKSYVKEYLKWIREEVLTGENRSAWKKGFGPYDEDDYLERIEGVAESKADRLAGKYGHLEGGKTKYYDELFAEFKIEKEKLLNEKLEEFKSMDEGEAKDELLGKIALSWYVCDIMQTMYNRGKKYGAGIYLVSAETALEKINLLVSEEEFSKSWNEFYTKFKEETYVWMRAHSYLLMGTSKRTDIDGRIKIEEHYFDFINPAYDPDILEAERKRVLYEAKS